MVAREHGLQVEVGSQVRRLDQFPNLALDDRQFRWIQLFERIIFVDELVQFREWPVRFGDRHWRSSRTPESWPRFHEAPATMINTPAAPAIAPAHAAFEPTSRSRPSANVTTAPNAAPDDTPNVYGPARESLSIDWNKLPVSDRAPPANNPNSVRESHDGTKCVSGSIAVHVQADPTAA